MMGVFAQAATANDGKIDFIGGVTDTTCDVVVNGQTNNALVRLPNVSSKLLQKTGDTAGRTGLTFELKNCGIKDGITKASVYFVAGPTINTAGRLDNTNAGGTKNVDLQILDSGTTAVNLALGMSVPANGAQPAIPGQGGSLVNIDQTSKTATIKHYVQYFATGQATAGGLTSNVEYEINYE